MKSYVSLYPILSMVLFLAFSCSNTSGEIQKKKSTEEESGIKEDVATNIQTKHIVVNERTIFNNISIAPASAFIVISKKYTDLSVYAPIGNDTVLLARYPVCLSRLLGQKEHSGDMKTPECSMEDPFIITQIQNASDWHHDFGDGRGAIKSYGDWFLRLRTPPHTGIGIHGSTNNESSVPGRDSEGCIRMRDEDIIHLKENYAYKGMKVVVKHENQDLLPFEMNIKVSCAMQADNKPKEQQIEELKSERVTIEKKPKTIEKAIADENSGSIIKYKIKKGDNLSIIAKRYNTSVSKICQINNIAEDAVLQIDQIIIIEKK